MVHTGVLPLDGDGVLVADLVERAEAAVEVGVAEPGGHEDPAVARTLRKRSKVPTTPPAGAETALRLMSLRVRLALVVLHGRVVGVEPGLEAGHGDDAVDNRLLAAQLSACGEEGATVLAVVVDDDPHLPVGVERYWRRVEVSTRGMAPKAPAR